MCIRDRVWNLTYWILAFHFWRMLFAFHLFIATLENSWWSVFANAIKTNWMDWKIQERSAFRDRNRTNFQFSAHPCKQCRAREGAVKCAYVMTATLDWCVHMKKAHSSSRAIHRLSQEDLFTTQLSLVLLLQHANHNCQWTKTGAYLKIYEKHDYL